MRWVDLNEAPDLLTYERDRDLLVTLQEPGPWVFSRLGRSA
jgi:hypothetical protein